MKRWKAASGSQDNRILKPGFRKLFLVGLVFWVLAYVTLSQSSLETSLYDYQWRTRVALSSPHTPPSELLIAAIDPAAFEAGMRREHLDQAALRMDSTAVNVTAEELLPFLQPDRDGTLRSIQLYLSEEGGLRLSPPLQSVLEHRGVDPSQVVITPGHIRFPGGEFKTDRKGRIYLDCPLVDRYSYSSEAGLLETLLRPPGHRFLTPFRALEPISIPDLLRKGVKTEDKLVLLGLYLPEAEEVEFYTPSGNMVRLELYSTVVSNLLTGDYLRPLEPWQGFLLSTLFLILLAQALPGRRTSSALGVWFFWLLGWLLTSQLLFQSSRFSNQSAALAAGLGILLYHLLLRSWRVHTFFQSLGGQAALQSAGEELVTTILFTNLPDVIKEWEETDPARAQAGREAHARCVGYLVNNHGGRLVDLQGDAQMVAFGLEGGRHQEQAAACALELVRAVRELLELEDAQVFCGLVTGPVATGQVGGGKYRSVAAIGDTTNSAARLMGRAKALGKPVLISEATASALGPRAETEELGELQVKGRAESLKVWELHAFSPPPSVLASAPKRDQRKLPFRIYWGTTLLSVAIASVLARNGYFHHLALDALTPSSQAAPIIFAGLDDSSLEFHPWPWPRSLHARIVENCLDAGAQCIFLDFLFEDPAETEEDSALESAILRSPTVLVAAAAQNDGQGLPTTPKLLPKILDSGQWGLVNHAPQHDSQVMRYALWQFGEPGHPGYLPGIAQKITKSLGKSPPQLQGRSSFLLRWGPKPRTISYQQLLNPKDPIFEELQGKVLIAGDNLAGRSDAFETPYGALKGAVLHALAVQTLLGDELLEDISGSFVALLLSWFCASLVLWAAWRIPGTLGQLALLAGSATVAALLLFAVSRLGYFLGAAPVLAAIVAAILGWFTQILDTNKALTSYVSRQLQEQLEQEGQVADLTTVGTILLTDIRGYTTLSEGRAPSEVLKLLNSYHEKTAAIYERFGGHLLTYQGDAQIVVFGPLEPLPNPTLNAVLAAQELPTVTDEVAQAAGLETGVLRVGCGITTGELTLSLMGAEGQLQYSVFGAPVRQAHHLQSLSDQVEDSIMLDRRSHFAVADVLRTTRHVDEEGEIFFTTGAKE